MQFVLQNLAFLNPNHPRCDIEAVVCKEKVQIQTTILFCLQRNDDSLNFLSLNSGRWADVFFHQLSQMPDYWVTTIVREPCRVTLMPD
jgi:hypothetical protein